MECTLALIVVNIPIGMHLIHNHMSNLSSMITSIIEFVVVKDIYGYMHLHDFVVK
jgi:hypothetical protein